MYLADRGLLESGLAMVLKAATAAQLKLGILPVLDAVTPPVFVPHNPVFQSCRGPVTLVASSLRVD